jgi:hypothetical protein
MPHKYITRGSGGLFAQTAPHKAPLRPPPGLATQRRYCARWRRPPPVCPLVLLATEAERTET